MKNINVGVIGIGFIGKGHIEALRRLNSINVVAVSDCNDEEAKKWALELNVPKAYGDWHDLIADTEIQAVHICTPTNLHYEMTKEALLAGKHVLCEKPFTLESSLARELIELCNAKRLIGGLHFNVEFYPLVHHVRDMVKKGDLGKILMISGTYHQDLLVKDTDYNWRMDPEYSAYSRVVSDIGSHWFDTAEFMSGMQVKSLVADFEIIHHMRKKPLHKVETYSSKVLTSNDYIEVEVKNEDYASMLLRFDNGVHGYVNVCQTVPGRKNRVYYEIVGEKGTAVYDTERPNELWIGHRDGNNEIVMKDPSLLMPSAHGITSLPGGHNEVYPDTIKQLFKQFYTFISEGGYEAGKEPLFPTFEAGLRQVLLTEAAAKSAKENAWVDVE